MIATTLAASGIATAGGIVVLVVLAGLAWVLPIYAAIRLSERRGRGPTTGLLLGVLLGWLGVLILALLSPVAGAATRRMPKDYRECPHCKEPVRCDASVCPHCRSESDPWRFHNGLWWVKQNGIWHYWDSRDGRLTRFQQDAPPGGGIPAAVATRECPACKEQMPRAASACALCGRESERWQEREGFWWRKEEDDWYYLDERTQRWIAWQERNSG